MDQKISELTDSERTWISAQLEGAIRFIDRFSPHDAGQPLSLAGLDRAFAAWIASGPTDVQAINETINFVGIAFGRRLVEDVGLKWVIATDQYGSDLAVHGLPGTGDVLIYPANFVAKRWERRETNFLESSFRDIERDVAELDRRWRKPERPWWKLW
jgi:Domain of unknown function (DUF3806)